MSRRGAGWLRWSGSLLIVLAVHGLAVGAALWWPTRTPPPADAAIQAVMVELAPLPEAPAQPATALPPGPRQVEQHKVTPAPRQKPVLPSEPEPLAEQPPQPDEAAPEETPSDTANVDQSSAPPEVQAWPSESSAARQTVSGTPGAAAETWRGLLLGHLEQHRRYPRQAERMRQQGVAYVRFSVDRQGAVSAIRIGRSSGHPLLDEATIATVQRGNPVPPPPAAIGGDPVEVMVPVEFFLHRR